MDGRLFRAITCFNYRNELPVLKLKLMNYMGEVREFEFIIDTGFSGGILLPRDEYEFFTCGELPRSLWRSYSTLIGVIPMRTAKAILIIDEAGVRSEVYVETPLYGAGRRLLGREVINRLIILLNGLRHNLCLCKEETHS